MKLVSFDWEPIVHTVRSHALCGRAMAFLQPRRAGRYFSSAGHRSSGIIEDILSVKHVRNVMSLGLQHLRNLRIMASARWNLTPHGSYDPTAIPCFCGVFGNVLHPCIITMHVFPYYLEKQYHVEIQVIISCFFFIERLINVK